MGTIGTRDFKVALCRLVGLYNTDGVAEVWDDGEADGKMTLVWPINAVLDGNVAR